MNAAAACTHPAPQLGPLDSPTGARSLPSGACTPPRCAQGTVGPSPDPSPETAVKRLIATIDTMQLQQAHAEGQRLAAERAAGAAQAEATSLQALLHAALLRLAELDDKEETVHSMLKVRLQEQAQRSEQLRVLKVRLAALVDEAAARSSSSANASSAQEQLEQELQQKQALARELQQRLSCAGVDEATLTQLCTAAAAHSALADGQQQPAWQQKQQHSTASAQRKATWLGGGGGGGSFLGSFRRRASATN